MFGKVKKILGIEGVKIELELPEEVHAKDEEVVGKIVFYSMNSQVVKSIEVKLIEKYSRGRKKEKLTDDYEIASITLDERIEVPADEALEIDFVLPFSLVKSEMDEFQGRNFLFRGLGKIAKKISAVKSEYRIEAEAKVEGTLLHPSDSMGIRVK
ncbi:MAG: sporulation protein [Bacteroidetes bacterium]|nr:sporulation protein [Bacteroidota bacterium]